MWAKETGYVSLSFILAILLVSSAAFGSENQLDKYPVRFVVIGDRTGEAQEGVYELALEEIERLKPDFVVTVGDMIEGPVFDSTELDRRWNEYLSLVKTLSMPIYFTPGNNDIDTDIMLPAYERFIGDPYFSFDHRGLHFVILDNSRTPTAAGVPDAQLEWLRKDLAAASDAEYTLAFMHKPTWYHTVSTGAQDSLHNVMRDGGVDAVFTGHFHTYFSGIYNGMVFTAVGSSGGGVTPGPTGIEYQYMWVTVDADGIHPVPVELGSVLPHDAVTSDDNRLYWTIRNSAISFEQPVLLDDKMTVTDAEVVVKVRNPNGSVPVTDTIRWELPENWYVTPPVAPFSVEPGQEAELAFNVSNDGQMYPPPSLSAEFLFADGKRSRARTYLACARTTSVPRASESPVIDGQIDETVW